MVTVCGLLLLLAVASASLLSGDGEQAGGSEYEAALELYGEGDFSGAEAALNQARSSEEASPEQSLLLGRTLEAQDRLAEAQAAYEASLAAQPAQPEALHSLALVLLAQGEVESAVEQLEKAIELEPEFVGARLLLADTYRGQGEAEKAGSQYRYVIQLEPVGVDVAALQEGLAGLD